MGTPYSGKFWRDLSSFSREYWVEVILFFIFVGVMFAGWLYIF